MVVCDWMVVGGVELVLVATAWVDGVHVMAEGLQSLMETGDGLVDGVLYQAFVSLESVERTGQIVVQLCLVEVGIVGTVQAFEGLYFFDEAVMR